MRESSEYHGDKSGKPKVAVRNIVVAADVFLILFVKYEIWNWYVKEIQKILDLSS